MPSAPCGTTPRGCPCGAFARLLRGDGVRPGTGTEAKARLPHGAFGAWCEGELDGLTRMTANNFMRCHEVFSGANVKNLDISPSALIALASGNVTDELRDGFVARAEAGERVTHAMVREAVRPGPPRYAVVDTETGEIVADGDDGPGMLPVVDLDRDDDGVPLPSLNAWEREPTPARDRHEPVEIALRADPADIAAVNRQSLLLAWSRCDLQVRRGLLTLPPQALAEAIPPERWGDIDLIVRHVAQWAESVKAARPSGLRRIGG